MPKHPFCNAWLTALFPPPPSAVSQVPARTEPTFVASEPGIFRSYPLDGGIGRSLRPEALFTCAATPSQLFRIHQAFAASACWRRTREAVARDMR